MTTWRQPTCSPTRAARRSYSGARAHAEGVHQSVIPIDGPELARLMFDRGVGVRTKDEYVVKAVDEAFVEVE